MAQRKKYWSNAARQRAYRERKKVFAVFAAKRVPPETVTGGILIEEKKT